MDSIPDKAHHLWGQWIWVSWMQRVSSMHMVLIPEKPGELGQWNIGFCLVAMMISWKPTFFWGALFSDTSIYFCIHISTCMYNCICVCVRARLCQRLVLTCMLYALNVSIFQPIARENWSNHTVWKRDTYAHILLLRLLQANMHKNLPSHLCYTHYTIHRLLCCLFQHFSVYLCVYFFFYPSICVSSICLSIHPSNCL